MAENLYLHQVQNGKNQWWRYLVGIVTILLIWQVGAGFLIVPILIQNQGNLPEKPEPVSFSLFLLGFAFLLFGTWGVNRILHGRSVRSLTTGLERIHWKRIFFAAGIWMVAVSLVAVVEAVMFPGRYVMNANPAAVLPYFLLGLILIPLQTSAEEFFFRGYLLQASGLLLRNPLLLALLNGILFTLPHLFNPEVEVMGLALSAAFYAAMGFFLALLTLRSQGLELALGIHAGNNFFTAVFANYVTTALPSESLFLIQTLDPLFGLASFVVAAVGVYGVFSLPQFKALAFGLER
ncbi:MAG: hypothetical protein ANABAC_1907 [Anaerolineae bacterium]|jgi:hypothetical protein|nr:MAG: hypothetical protein ANABAC_1907 [Anaerolineae bacterium]